MFKACMPVTLFGDVIHG